MSLEASPRRLRCWAEIDLAALERNLKKIRAALPPHMRYVAVVKADAYGHGLHHVAARLMHAGADLFAVANVTEAAALRELGPGWPILILGPVLPDEDPALVDGDLAATVSSLAEVERFDALGRAAGKPIAIHLKIDTGMGRVGVWHEESSALFARIAAAAHVRLEGVFTHFASSDDDPQFTAEQRRRFVAALDAGARVLGRGARPPAPSRSNEPLAAQNDNLRNDFLRPPSDLRRLFIHADNSAGIATLPDGGAGPFNAVRIGLLQFGVLPGPHSLLANVKTEPVFSFHTRVGLVKRLPAGTSISYGRTHVLRRDATVAILCAGYADGVPRAASNRGVVLIRGARCPILGRVTMDQTIIDVTDVPAVTNGDEAVLIGHQAGNEITVGEFSRLADTIPWETFTSVTKRVPRVYRTALGV